MALREREDVKELIKQVESLERFAQNLHVKLLKLREDLEEEALNHLAKGEH